VRACSRSGLIIAGAEAMKPTLILMFAITNMIAGCTSTGSNPVADMPSWMGGLPAGAPPRPGTPAYDAWQAERAKKAVRPKGTTPLVEGGPHGFAALCRHNDSALERAHLQGRLWRLLAPSPAPEPFHPPNHGEGVTIRTARSFFKSLQRN
jgi:hypothetical protein